jgi:hypothetical protein
MVTSLAGTASLAEAKAVEPTGMDVPQAGHLSTPLTLAVPQAGHVTMRD